MGVTELSFFHALDLNFFQAFVLAFVIVGLVVLFTVLGMIAVNYRFRARIMNDPMVIKVLRQYKEKIENKDTH
ncbi:hypothetical protein [Defluviitalea saccharophila]|uniref:DUF4083 domain-containing protein n=1 Tax=Defluviitalea saccharophila TaxID=879970 RepID=A0ABZ2Y5N6_9FIRM